MIDGRSNALTSGWYGLFKEHYSYDHDINVGWSTIGNLYPNIVSTCQPKTVHTLEGGEKGNLVINNLFTWQQRLCSKEDDIEY